MEQYQLKFITEAKELVSDLEAGLFDLEQTPDKQATINEVFRIMHSLKGSGAMFGFTKTSALTHDLENVYSAIRSGKLKVSKHLIDLSFQAIDQIKILLDSFEREYDDLVIEKISMSLKTIMHYRLEQDDEIPDPRPVAEAEPKATPQTEGKSFLIKFNPNQNLLQQGNNPLYLLEELSSMGQFLAVPYFTQLPTLEQLDPLLCYTAWNMILCTNLDETAIREVFIFTEKISEIKIHNLPDFSFPDSDKGMSDLQNILKEQDPDFLSLLSCSESHPLNKEAEVETVSVAQPVLSNPPEKVHMKGDDSITIRVSSQKIDELMNLVSELIVGQGQLAVQTDLLRNDVLFNLNEKFEKLIRQLREQTMEMSLISFNTLSTRLKRLCRDLSGQLNKKIELRIEGGETELDKTIIEQLSEPLLHILRNSIDHGIENPKERIQKGKNETGLISVKAFYSSAEVHIEITDDGRGIDPAFVLKRAKEKGLVTHEEHLSNHEILKLLFVPGFSTNMEATEVSGRGVGMDVVETKIGALRGEVSIDSQPGSGTTVLIKLPLTLTILDGLLTKVSDTTFIIPMTAIRKIYQLKLSEIETAFNNLAIIEGEQIPFLILRMEFGYDPPSSLFQHLILVEYENKRIGLIVDEILGERQAVLKPLGPSFRKNKIISGGSIMGDGQIALILDTNKLIRQFTTQEIKKDESS